MRPGRAYVVGFAFLAFIACAEPTNPGLAGSPELRLAQNASTTGPTVTSTLPSTAARDTTLDVQVYGTGFSTGAQAALQLNGVSDPRVRVNNTKFVKSTQLTANITIATDAVVGSYDVVVSLTTGKKGIGTELFTVLSMEQLSSPSGNSAANDVNSTGLIVGGRAGGCDSHQLPAYWSNGGPPIDLPLLAPWCFGNAMFVNEAGLIIGHMNPGSTLMVGVLWTPDGLGGYTVSDLGTLEGHGADLMGLNNAGLIVANIDVFSNETGGGFWRTPQTPWQRLQKVSGATACYADAINDSNEIAGFCYVSGISNAAFWASPTAVPQLLPRLPTYDYAHTAHGLNNTGVAVGYAMKRTKSGSVTTGVKWIRSGTPATWAIYVLPDLGGGESMATDVNDAGWIVGNSTLLGGKKHAALWKPGAPIKDLGAIGPQSWAFGITPSSASQTIVTGVGDVGSYKRGVVYRPQ